MINELYRVEIAEEDKTFISGKYPLGQQAVEIALLKENIKQMENKDVFIRV